MELESIHEVGGYVSVARAAELMEYSNPDQARRLVGRGLVEAKRWEGKALMISKESLLNYKEIKKRGRPKKDK